jgi:Fe-S cluster assembly iron-binding protein IscA
MATVTAAPAPETEKKAPLHLTPQAIAKVREIMATQDPLPAGLRMMYLNGCTVDYVETLEAAGFKFDNPQVKSTCGCGSSFSV